MRRRPFGTTGREVPVVGQGTWQLRDPEAAEKALRLGLDLGLEHIDTAELYTGSEEVVGRAIAGRRRDVFLVSKVLPRNASYRGTIEACQRSLERLHTDYLDVYLIHWWDTQHPIDETMRALGELADAGRIRHIGVSNFDVPQLEVAQQSLGSRHPIVCDQVFYDLEHRHAETLLLPHCKKNRIAVVGYSPFGSGRGRLGGKGAKTLEAVASRHNVTPHQVVLNFLARDPNVFLIPKAENLDHVRTNAAALDFELTHEDIRELETAFPVPKRAVELPTL